MTASGQRRFRVLLAVDNETHWEAALNELRKGKWNLDVALARTEQDYDGKIRGGDFDLIVADLGENGIRTTRALRKCRQSGKNTPFVVLAEHLDEAKFAGFRKHGASDCIQWSDVARLLPAVQRQLAALDEQRSHEPAVTRSVQTTTPKTLRTTNDATETADEPARREELALVGILTGSIANELKQPLAVIRSAIYFLNMHSGQQMDEKVRKHMSLIWRAVETADSSVSELLALADQKLPERADMSPTIIVLDALNRVRVPKNIEIESAINEFLPSISADPMQIVRAFVNLLRTAIEAMPEGGRLSVTAQTDGQVVVVEVQDTGPEIPADILRQVYEPQFTTEIEGRALRLAVARNLVERNGGKIEIQSGADRGTMCTLRFPSRGTILKGGGANGG